MKTAPLKPLDSIKGDLWERIYDVTLTEAATSLTISGLNGDVDEEYILESKVVNGYNGAIDPFVRPNNDTGTNYGYQYLEGTNNTRSALRGTTAALGLSSITTLGGISHGILKLFAKSGFVRTAIVTDCREVSGTTVTSIYGIAYSWNNTADNITSLVIAASQAGGLGVGSSFQLYRKSRRS